MSCRVLVSDTVRDTVRDTWSDTRGCPSFPRAASRRPRETLSLMAFTDIPSRLAASWYVSQVSWVSVSVSDSVSRDTIAQHHTSETFDTFDTVDTVSAETFDTSDTVDTVSASLPIWPVAGRDGGLGCRAKTPDR